MAEPSSSLTSAATQPASQTASSSTLSSPSALDAIPQEAAVSVVRGSLTAAGAMSVGSACWGVTRALPALPLAVRGGLNTFFFAFPFFALREYVLNPYVFVERDSLAASQPRSASHLANVPQSALAGAIVGAGMAASVRGPRALAKGAVTFGALCTGLQLAGNELGLLRRSIAARVYAPSASSSSSSSSAGGAAVEVGGDGTAVQGSSTSTGALSRLASPFDTAIPPGGARELARGNAASASSAGDAGAASTPTTEPASPSPSSSSSSSSSWLAWVASMSPVRKLSEEEYRAKLETRQAQEQRRQETGEHRRRGWASRKDVEETK